jgi:hypothetical protein
MSGEPLDFSKLPDVSKLHPELDEDERIFAAHMKAREDAYAHIFGQTDPPNQILSPSDPELTINWPGGGVYAFPPRGERSGWHYVTHGLAQPFDGPEDFDEEDEDEPVSGLGIELVISTPSPCDWAPLLLIDCVRYMLFDENASLIVPGDRMPTRAFESYAGGSLLTHMIATTSEEYDHHILLPAGQCTLVHLVGVTAEEVARAKEMKSGDGTQVLSDVLAELGPGYVTDTKRPCTTQDPRFEKAWNTAAASLS